VTPFLVISPVSLSSYSTSLCIVAGWVVVDKNIHTIGAKQLPRHNTENSKQLFQEKEMRGLSLYFHIYVSVTDLYIPRIDLPILLQENKWIDPGNI
jgi:hypothetical protein